MATLTVYENGASAGRGNNAPTGGPRGQINGWTAATVSRHKKWLYSVQHDRLDGDGYGVTLTVRDTPHSHEDWTALVARLTRAFRDAGLIRWHWVVEWQRRGTPHLHLAVYAPAGWSSTPFGRSGPTPISDTAGDWAVAVWLRLAADYAPGRVAQVSVPITGPLGWSRYLSKHASRGVAHYQRQGSPAGWTGTGRLWGQGGSWPRGEEIKIDLGPAFHQWRRLVMRYVAAQARSAVLAAPPGSRQEAAARKRHRTVKRLLRNPDRGRSASRGVSEWVPQLDTLALALCAGWTGEVMSDAV